MFELACPLAPLVTVNHVAWASYAIWVDDNTNCSQLLHLEGVRRTRQVPRLASHQLGQPDGLHDRADQHREAAAQLLHVEGHRRSRDASRQSAADVGQVRPVFVEARAPPEPFFNHTKSFFPNQIGFKSFHVYWLILC